MAFRFKSLVKRFAFHPPRSHITVVNVYFRRFCSRVPMVHVTVVCAVFSVITVTWSLIVGQLAATGSESANALDCKKKLYTFQVSKTDSNGKVCSDEINVMSCWGRCDSNEVSLVEYSNKLTNILYSNRVFAYFSFDSNFEHDFQ